MRKLIALIAVVVGLSLGVSVAEAGDRSGRSRATTVTPTTQSSSMTVSRLLHARLQQTLRLVRAFDGAADVTGSIGSHTIIDEPDPAGRKKGNGKKKDDDTSAEEDRKDQEDAANDGKKPLKEVG